MQNKILINKIKDYAELAWASYGYFDLIGKKLKDRQDEQGNALVITLHDILDSAYKNYIAMGKDRWGQDIKLGTLKGDFSEIQLQQFFKRYELLKHCPNTESGFSATLFKDTKADSKDSEYILAIRGTEPSDWEKDIVDADMDLMFDKLPSNQYILDMLKFYTQCIIDKHITESTSLESL